MQTLPKKLKKEPLIDAVFEVRFTSAFPAGGVLPGLLFGNLDGDKKIEQLPLSQLPQVMRDEDPNLRFAPLSRLDWGQFYINIGDRSVSVGFKYPYPGWNSFKPAIIKVMDALKGANVIKSVDRYSLKYIDLLPATDLREQVSLVNFDVTLAGHKLKDEAFQIRLDIPRGDFIHVVQMVSSATATLHTGESKQGLIVDVDTIANQQGETLEGLLSEFSDKLETIHTANKKVFFDCLKPETIKALEPEYV
ncbi:MAG: TIGR04255 family protein [Gammaproteobacteria bacterium]|nr:TIGR04255 family protein [Gammaproteobacteria bacterium]